MDATIVIPTRTNLTRFVTCVESLLAAPSLDHPFEVVVVDASEAGLPSKWAWSNGLRAVVRPEATFGEAVNLGAAQAQSEIIVLLNDDTITSVAWLDALLKPRIGAHIVGARLLYPAAEGLAEIVQHGGIGFDVAGNPYQLWKGAPADHAEALVPRVLPAVTFACAAIPRFIWKALGGLDERYRNGYEDIDFCLRAREKGYVVAYEPRAVLTHAESQTPNRYANEAENKALFNREWVESGRLAYNLGQWPFQP